MVRNSLRNLTASAPPKGSASTLAIPVPQANNTQLPADVRQLLEEREKLQSKMASLTGQQTNSAATRFPITSLSKRRMDDEVWAKKRDDSAILKTLNDGQAPSLASLYQADNAEPPERSGQRALGLLTERTGLSDRLEPKLRQPALPELTNLAKKKPLETLRSINKTPPMGETSHALSHAARRLDLLQGGSGDLDKLRALALSRHLVRRKQETAWERRRKPSDPDSNKDAARDAARLDSRPTAERRNNDV